MVLWVGMLATVAWIIFAGFTHFNARLAFDFPPHAFTITPAFMAGLGGATLIAMYDFLGYYGICFVGGEVRQPEKVMPRSIVLSVLVAGVIYALMTLAIMAVVPWREAVQSKFIAARFMEIIYGTWAGGAVTLLILWTSVAGVFALVLAYSRVPYAAALDGYFWKPFARLHPKGDFPYVSLLVIGGLAIAERNAQPRLGSFGTAHVSDSDPVHGTDCGGGSTAQNAPRRAPSVPHVAVSAA